MEFAVYVWNNQLWTNRILLKAFSLANVPVLVTLIA